MVSSLIKKSPYAIAAAFALGALFFCRQQQGANNFTQNTFKRS